MINMTKEEKIQKINKLKAKAESLKKESLYKKIEYKQHNLKVSYLVDITHNLLLKYYFKKDNIFNLSSIVLKEKYGYIYNYYIDYLVESKILILVKKHQKPVPALGQQGGIVEQEAAIDASNVAIFNAATGKADRIGFRFEDGKKVRFFKSNGEIVSN